jgi:hypothetical protein
LNSNIFCNQPGFTLAEQAILGQNSRQRKGEEDAMDENAKSQDSLVEEFRNLGQNLIVTLRTAWGSPERKLIQDEIEEGLADLAVTFKQEAAAFRDSPTGQRIKSDAEEFRQRMRSGEIESQIHSELLNALRLINHELEKVSASFSESQQAGETAASSSAQGQEG